MVAWWRTLFTLAGLAAWLTGLTLGVLMLSQPTGPAPGLARPPLHALPHPDRTVALVLTGAPNGSATLADLGLLKRFGAGATFAVVGKRALAAPGLVRRLATPPFAVADAGFSGTGESPEDLKRGAEVILDLTGRMPRYALGGRASFATTVLPLAAPLALPDMARFADHVPAGSIVALPSDKAALRALALLLITLRARRLSVRALSWNEAPRPG
jgi:peptidoglycan/xylan/chitin deacetylase (PgdA/CDA1 family)